MNKKIVNGFVFLCSTFIVLSSVTVFAATLLTYSGTGIRGWYSVNNFVTNSQKTITISHTNSSWNVPTASQIMEVQIHKKGAVFYSATGQTMTTSGTGRTQRSFSIPSGDYKLYFHAPASSAAASISGSVTD
ncbi:MAG: hypothetical protein ACRC17_08450 [Culicoidibacterales bacterium]